MNKYGNINNNNQNGNINNNGNNNDNVRFLMIFNDIFICTTQIYRYLYILCMSENK